MTGKRIRAAASAAVVLICSAAVIRIFAEEQDKYESTPAVRSISSYTAEVGVPALETTAESTVTTEEAASQTVTEAADAAAASEPYTDAEQNNTYVYNVQFPLDLNAASFEDLMQLPGIGEETAANIIAYRKSTGGFRSRQELLKVKGIGAARYDRIYDLLFIEGEMREAAEESIPDEQPTEFAGIILDVNTATAEDFAMLPGVDIELGRRITELREEIGGYKNILELLYVEGMSDELYVSIDEFLVCENKFY